MTALTDPVRPGARFGVTLGGANFGLQLVVNSVPHVLMALQIQDMDPAHKEIRLGVATAVAALLVAVAQPLWGVLSDRSRSRFGRRTPFVLGGALMTAAGLLALSASDTYTGLLIAWCATTVALTAVQATLMAALPDRVPVSARGVFAAAAGLGGTLGALGGQILFAKLVGGGYLLPYAVAAIIVAGSAGLFVWLNPEPPAEPSPRPKFSLRSLWVNPVEHPDFAWVFLSRMFVLTGFFMVNGYLLYILADHLGLGRDRALHRLPLVSMVSVVTVVIALAIAGVWSDRVGRRKPFVFWSAVLMAVGLTVTEFATSIPAVVVCIVVIALGYGTFRAIDEALITLVLPATDSAGQYIGIAHLSTHLANAAAPAIAGVTIAFAGGYAVFFPLAGALALVGALCLLPLRSVR